MKRSLIAAFIAFTALGACTKEPGEGGTASIRGTIVRQFRLVPTNPATVQNTVPGADADVYIIYGDNVSPDDRVWTNGNGEFEFRFLRKGDYTIYAYSVDTIGNTGVDPNRMVVQRKVTIDDRNGTVDLGEMLVVDLP
jgi:hypothetical protein